MTTNTREPDYWTYITKDQCRAFSPIKPPDNTYTEGTLEPLYTAHPAITHCDNCGCDWLDNGLNPVGCPYCKQIAGAIREHLIRLGWTPPKHRRYDPSGSLSEYGIFPECDARPEERK